VEAVPTTDMRRMRKRMEMAGENGGRRRRRLM
jgi:hypothetical protein